MNVHFTDGTLFWIFAGFIGCAVYFLVGSISVRERLIRIETKLNILFESVPIDRSSEQAKRFFGKK